MPAPGKMSSASMKALPTMPKMSVVPCATSVSTKASLDVILVGVVLHAGAPSSSLRRALVEKSRAREADPREALTSRRLGKRQALVVVIAAVVAVIMREDLGRAAICTTATVILGDRQPVLPEITRIGARDLHRAQQRSVRDRNHRSCDVMWKCTGKTQVIVHQPAG